MELNKEIKGIVRNKFYQSMKDIDNWRFFDGEYKYNVNWGDFKFKIDGKHRPLIYNGKWDQAFIKINYFKKISFIRKFKKNETLKKRKDTMDMFLNNIPEEEKKNLIRKMKLDRLI